MRITLLIITLFMAIALSIAVAKIFDNLIRKFFAGGFKGNKGKFWVRNLKFIIIAIGISGGVRIWQIGEHTLQQKGEQVTFSTAGNLVLQIFKTIFDTFQDIAWLLVNIFVIVLIIYYIVRSRRIRAKNSEKNTLDVN